MRESRLHLLLATILTVNLTSRVDRFCAAAVFEKRTVPVWSTMSSPSVIELKIERSLLRSSSIIATFRRISVAIELKARPS